jgi:pseudouridine-5'-phosphate glycosidase
VAVGQTGATTVAATMIIAALAGIRVFATGGIGGVHRGAGESFDISADLLELARTPVAVVCAGVKSILDIRLTLEVLETHGVPVVGYGTDRLPAFFAATAASAWMRGWTRRRRWPARCRPSGRWACAAAW